MADKNSNSNKSSFLSSLLGALATIAVFAILVILAYGLGGKDEVAVVSGDLPPSAADLRAQEAEALTSYGWIDQEKGIVRIPVDKAKDLVIQDLNQ